MNIHSIITWKRRATYPDRMECRALLTGQGLHIEAGNGARWTVWRYV